MERKGIRARIERLERRQGGEERFSSEEARAAHARRCERDWRMEVEAVATDIILGAEPKITLSPEGVFYTLDGHFAVSRTEGADMRAMMGSNAEALADSIPHERWEQFLEESAEGCCLLEELEAVAAATDPPDNYWTWLQAWPHDPDQLAALHNSDNSPPRRPAFVTLTDDESGEPVLGADEEELLRRLAWALINAEQAREFLVELCKLRDAWILRAPLS